MEKKKTKHDIKHKRWMIGTVSVLLANAKELNSISMSVLYFKELCSKTYPGDVLKTCLLNAEKGSHERPKYKYDQSPRC